MVAAGLPGDLAAGAAHHEAVVDVRAVQQRLVDVGLQRVTRPPRGASSAVITTRALQSLIRLASASGEKPAKTIEWMAPMRAQASMA